MTVRYEDVCCDPVHKYRDCFPSHPYLERANIQFIKASTLGVRLARSTGSLRIRSGTTAFFEIQSARQISGGVR